jgi:hypothetical protein
MGTEPSNIRTSNNFQGKYDVINIDSITIKIEVKQTAMEQQIPADNSTYQ